MAIAAKIYNKMILNRLVPFVGPLLRKNQNGFRRGRTTLSQILCLRRILEESQATDRDLALVFVDFSKAFDSVDREKMFNLKTLWDPRHNYFCNKSPLHRYIFNHSNI